MPRIHLGTRQPHGHIVAEPKGSVVPSIEFNGLDGEVCPLRKLCSDQSAHERYMDVYIGGRHLISVDLHPYGFKTDSVLSPLIAAKISGLLD